MSPRAGSPCIMSGCPHRAVDRGRCEQHARESNRAFRAKYPDQRPSSSDRGYGAEWRKVRDAFLAKHPYCRICEDEGKQERATDVDHIVPRRKGGTDEPSNLQSLCKHHHSTKTAILDGGFGHSRQ